MPSTKPPLDNQFLSRTHAAELLDCSPQLIDKKIKLGELSSYHFGRKVLIKKQELLKLLEVGRGR